MKTSKNKISKFGLLIIASLFMYSCGQSKEWSDEDKTKFVSGCVKSNKGAVSEEKANELCNCMLDQMVEKYPTMVESQAMKPEEIREMALSCK